MYQTKQAKVNGYSVDVKRFFVEDAKKVNKKGNPLSVPITQRKMYVTWATPITDSGFYRVFRSTRNGKVQYTISALARKEQSCWANPSGRCEVWFVVGDKYVRTDYPAMDEVSFLNWLTIILGFAKAREALWHLENDEPAAKAA